MPSLPATKKSPCMPLENVNGEWVALYETCMQIASKNQSICEGDHGEQDYQRMGLTDVWFGQLF